MASSSVLARMGAEFLWSLKKEFKLYVRYPSAVIGNFLGAPLWFVFFGLGISIFAPTVAPSAAGQGFNLSVFFWGWVFLAYLFSSVWDTGHTLRNEQLSGTLEQLFLTPTKRLAVLAGRTARSNIMSLIWVFYFGAMFSLITRTPIDILNPALFVGVFVAMLIMFAGFGMVYAAMVMRLKTPEAISELLGFLMLILSGVFFPVTVLPQPLLAVALVIPFTYAVDLLKSATVGTPALLGNVSLELLLVYALAVGLLFLGLRLFTIFEANAKRTGRLGVY